MIHITIPGPPRGKGRPRFTSRGGFARAYTDKKTRDYEKTVAEYAILAMEGQPPLSGALRVELRAYFPIPKSWTKAKKIAAANGDIHHLTKPDADNILKVLDALNGVAFEDDKQICDARIIKDYSNDPRLEIQIWEIQPNERVMNWQFEMDKVKLEAEK